MNDNTEERLEAPAAKVAGVALAGAEVGSHLVGKINRRTLIYTLLGTSIGFGVGVAFHALWRTLVDVYTRRSDTDRLISELENLKRDLLDVRQLLHSNEDRSRKRDQLEAIPPFYLSDDEEECFYDIDESDRDCISSKPASYSSALDYLNLKQGILRLGPALPEPIAEELDHLAQLAMGDFCSTSSTPKIGAWGDESRLGTQAYARCVVYHRKYRRTPEFLWRFARATFLASEDLVSEEDLSTTLNDPGDAASDATSESSHTLDPRNANDMAYEISTRRQFVETGLGLARRALRLALHARQEQESNVSNGCLAEIYKWLAVLVGLACDFGGIQQRITYGKEFKTLIDRAIELQPKDALSHYLKGRWCYQVYHLTWIERQFASRLFDTPPTATIEEARAAFEEAEKLRPNFYAANELYLAKCLISQSNYKEAGFWLQRAQSLTEQQRAPPPHLDTMSVSAEINSLRSKYATYF